MKQVKSFKAFMIGAVIGAFFVAGVSHASTGWTKLDVYMEKLTYKLNGQEIKPSDRDQLYYNGEEYVPAGFIYKGTTYVPLRFVAEAGGSHVAWDGKTKTISISSSTEVQFQTEDINTLDETLQQWVERSLSVELGQSMNHNGKTYILVTRGMKPTGGYSVDVESITRDGDEIVVTVKYTDPDPDSMVTQAITHPYTLISMEETGQPIRFEGLNEQYIPKLVGLKVYPEVLHESDAIKVYELNKGSDSTTVKGIARIFEASLNYRVVSPEGSTLTEGFVQTLAGAPDWGTFQLSIDHSLLSADQTWTLELFEASAKDGSPVHVVKIELNI